MRSATGRMMREDWRFVGEALLIGRAECLSEKTGKLHNRRFGEWCQSNGFGSINITIRTNAVWLVEGWEKVAAVLGETQDPVNDPTKARKAYRKAAALGEQTALKAMKFYRMADSDLDSHAERTIDAARGILTATKRIFRYNELTSLTDRVVIINPV